MTTFDFCPAPELPRYVRMLSSGDEGHVEGRDDAGDPWRRVLSIDSATSSSASTVTFVTTPTAESWNAVNGASHYFPTLRVRDVQLDSDTDWKRARTTVRARMYWEVWPAPLPTNPRAGIRVEENTA